MRFIEIEKHTTKVSNTKDIQSNDYKLSFIYFKFLLILFNNRLPNLQIINALQYFNAFGLIG